MSKLIDKIYEIYSDQWAFEDKKQVKARLERSKKGWMHGIGKYIPINRESVIVDLGCGYGDAIWNMQILGYKNVFGYDLSENQIEYGKKSGVENIFLDDALGALTRFSDRSIDCILLIDVIEHLHDELLLDILNECKRTLKVGGCLVIRAPNGGSPYMGSIRYGDCTHLRAFTEYSMSQVFTVVNMKKFTFHECQPIPSSIFGYIRLLFWKIIRLGHVFHDGIETGYLNLKGVWSKNMIAIVKNE